MIDNTTKEAVTNRSDHKRYHHNHQKKVHISKANTDLLFKLFEDLEKKDKKQLELQMHHLKLYR
jgi:glycyl-tRNA synthetase alpha subunit